MTRARDLAEVISGGSLSITGAFTSPGIDDNASATAVTIDAGGSVLIGKSTPTDLHNTWNHLIIGEKGAIISENGSGGIDGISISDNAYIDSDTGGYAYQTTDEASKISQTGSNIIFSNASSGSAGSALSFSERMRINSSGHVLLGTTTDGTTAVGTVIRDAGEVLITRASNPPLLVNRTTDSGDIIEIRNDNSRVGSIQQRFGSIQVGSSNTNLIFNSGASEIAPSSDSGGTNDSVLTLGANNRRFKNIFMNGTIFNEKTTYALENTEGMVIDDSAQIIMESDNGVLLRLNRMNGNGHGLQFYRGATNQVGSISFNTSSTTFNTSSDYRLKENVSYDFDATSRLKKLKPARFNFKTEKDITVDGFLAHEVSDIVPEAVSGEKDAMTKEVLYVEGEPIPDGKKVGDVKEASKIDPQGIDQSKLVPLLVKTIQELEARITALEGA